MFGRGAFGLSRYPWLLSFWRGYSLFCWGYPWFGVGTFGCCQFGLGFLGFVGIPLICWGTLCLVCEPLVTVTLDWVPRVFVGVPYVWLGYPLYG